MLHREGELCCRVYGRHRRGEWHWRMSGSGRTGRRGRTPAKTSARHQTSTVPGPDALVLRSAPKMGVPMSMETPTTENASPILSLCPFVFHAWAYVER